MQQTWGAISSVRVVGSCSPRFSFLEPLRLLLRNLLHVRARPAALNPSPAPTCLCQTRHARTARTESVRLLHCNRHGAPFLQCALSVLALRVVRPLNRFFFLPTRRPPYSPLFPYSSSSG